MAKLHEDWIAFLKLLNARHARYLIVGAHAVAAHGRPRLTADLDIWVEPNLQMGAARVSYLGVRQLIANKAAAGRPKDLADLALLAEAGVHPTRRSPLGKRRSRA